MYVIGTAGHVDHGKSTLVKTLTGIDPDRWEEEQRREMTIDLGFAWLALPSGRSVSIVDVPGHERFIKNMLAGVGGIDAALLVIAADESLMPQTEKRVLPESVVYTDEGRGYGRLERSGYQHHRIHHAQEIWVMGDVHTNTIEGFWSLVKRGIAGIHHAVSAKWLQGYLNEYAWRFNHRDDGQAMFLTLLLRSATITTL